MMPVRKTTRVVDDGLFRQTAETWHADDPASIREVLEAVAEAAAPMVQLDQAEQEFLTCLDAPAPEPTGNKTLDAEMLEIARLQKNDAKDGLATITEIRACPTFVLAWRKLGWIEMRLRYRSAARDFRYGAAQRKLRSKRPEHRSTAALAERNAEWQRKIDQLYARGVTYAEAKRKVATHAGCSPKTVDLATVDPAKIVTRTPGNH